jgi:hypothetical protein
MTTFLGLNYIMDSISRRRRNSCVKQGDKRRKTQIYVQNDIMQGLYFNKTLALAPLVFLGNNMPN